MNQPTDNKSEDKAIDALMAAAFRLSGSDRPMTEKEAKELAANPPKLSPEDEEMMASMGADFVDRILQQCNSDKVESMDTRFTLDSEIRDAYMAMNRGNKDDDLSEETKREIERKRRELLGEDESEEDIQNGSQPD